MLRERPLELSEFMRYLATSGYAVDGFIEDWALSPKGERALFVARGDVFTAPIEHGPTRT